MSPAEWAAYTGRLEVVRLIQRLLERPCPEQFGDKYKPELPQGLQGAAKPAASSKNCLQKFTRFLRGALGPRARDPQDGGVLDHMVRMTTSHSSPAVAVACQTVCPESPPRVGKRRLAVQEIVQARARRDARAPEEEPGQGRGPEPPPPPPPAQTSGVCGEGSPPRPPGAPRKASLLALHRLRRGSVRPGVVIPRVRVSKAPAPTFQPERPPAKGSTKDSGHLQLPKWRYKEAKEEKRKAEEAERQRAAQAQKERRAPPWRKRT